MFKIPLKELLMALYRDIQGNKVGFAEVCGCSTGPCKRGVSGSTFP